MALASLGLPARAGLAELMQAVRGADTVMGHDPQCANWIRNYRNPLPDGVEARGGRRGGRRGIAAEPVPGDAR